MEFSEFNFLLFFPDHIHPSISIQRFGSLTKYSEDIVGIFVAGVFSLEENFHLPEVLTLLQQGDGIVLTSEIYQSHRELSISDCMFTDFQFLDILFYVLNISSHQKLDFDD